MQIAGALVAVALGFAVEMGAAGQTVGNGVAWLIALLAEPILSFLGLDLVRSGIELRSLADNWAVRVSEVCDGMGLVVAMLAAIALLAPGQARPVKWGVIRTLIGIVAIQAFNLLRVVLLALALAQGGAGFEALHDWVFPLLSLFAIAATLIAGRRLAVFAVLALALTVLWAPIAETVSGLLVPLANAVLAPFAPVGVGEIGQVQETWSVGTLFVAGNDPLRLYRAPLSPHHFTVALPAVVAATIVVRRPEWVLLALPMMVLVLSVAASVAVMGLAAEKAPLTVLLPDGGGAFDMADYVLPEALFSGLQLVQNTLVHALLLVFPVLAVSERRVQEVQ